MNDDLCGMPHLAYWKIWRNYVRMAKAFPDATNHWQEQALFAQARFEMESALYWAQRRPA